MNKILSFAAAAAVVALSWTICAGETDTLVKDKKVLVVYYSKTGNTERVAKDVASALHADIEKLVDKKNRNGFWAFFSSGRDAMNKKKTELGPLEKDPANYDLVVLGTPVWSKNLTPAIRTYLDMNRDKLKNTAYIVTSNTAPAEKVIPMCEELTGKKCMAYAGFTAKMLKNGELYRKKLAGFIDELKK
jgi:flavodoxin